MVVNALQKFKIAYVIDRKLDAGFTLVTLLLPIGSYQLLSVPYSFRYWFQLLEYLKWSKSYCTMLLLYHNLKIKLFMIIIISQQKSRL